MSSGFRIFYGSCLRSSLILSSLRRYSWSFSLTCCVTFYNSTWRFFNSTSWALITSLCFLSSLSLSASAIWSLSSKFWRSFLVYSFGGSKATYCSSVSPSTFWLSLISLSLSSCLLRFFSLITYAIFLHLSSRATRVSCWLFIDLSSSLYFTWSFLKCSLAYLSSEFSSLILFS